MKKIAILGWAFDPPHAVHEEIWKMILDRKELWFEKLIVVPSWPNDYKVFKAQDEFRRRILEIFMKSFNSYNAELCPAFLSWELGPTTTRWIDDYFKATLGYSPYQIFGTDVIPNMNERDPTWYVGRVLPKIFIKRKWYEPDMSQVDNYVLIEPEFDDELRVNLSSTQVRENIRRRIFDWLNPEIAEYIRNNNLYL